MVAWDCPAAELTSCLQFPVSLLEVHLLSKAARPCGKHTQLLGSFSNFPTPASELMRAKLIAKSPCDEFSSVRGVVARSHPLSHLLALLAEFNLVCKTCLLHLREVTFLPCVSLVFLAFHRAAWSHWSRFCWFSQVKVSSPFCLTATKSSHVLAEYSPICLF